MRRISQNGGGVLLPGLDGSNPLAYLAALGTLRALSDAWTDRTVKMSWIQVRGAWRAQLHFASTREPTDEVVSALSNYLPYRSLSPSPNTVRHRLRVSRGARALKRMENTWARQGISKKERKAKKQCLEKLIGSSRSMWLESAHPYLLIGKNTTLPACEYRVHLLKIAEAAKEQRFLHDQFASLGSDLRNERGVMLDTALRTMSGSGHQHQLEFMGNLLEQLTPQALRRTLLEPWDYADPVRNLTLRLDPVDDSRYALQWGNPSTDPARDDSGSMLGANALAVVGFSLLSTVPVTKGLGTVGFAGTGSRDTFWRWPVWEVPICIGILRSLLAYSRLQDEAPCTPEIHALGVAVVYCAQRISVDKFRNFTPARVVMT
jgi:hypothetical protein